MSLEGNVRDLQLPEVFQLLAHGRKSGQLLVSAQLAGLSASVWFDRGLIVDAVIATATTETTAAHVGRRNRMQVEAAALELLTWHDGFFKFVPAAPGSEMNGLVRLSTEMVLVEGARRIEGWARLSDRIPHARTVPAFITETTHLPLLHLVPQQWEVLTQVDGKRDLPSLASALGKDLLDVAEIVYGLIETGLLMLVDAARPARALATPPAAVPIVTDAPSTASMDLWVPTNHAGHASAHDDEIDDVIFDPVRIGVITPEGLPRWRTPLVGRAVQAVQRSSRMLRTAGDDALRQGQLQQAMALWNSSVKAEASGPDAAHCREAIALTARLMELVSRQLESGVNHAIG